MFRALIEVGFRSDTAQEFRDGNPQKRNVFVAVYCQVVAGDDKQVKMNCFLTVDYRPCPELSKICHNGFLVRALPEANSPAEVICRVTTALDEFKRHFQSHLFDLPEMMRTMREVRPEEARLRVRG